MKFKEYLKILAEYLNQPKEWEYMIGSYIPIKPGYFDEGTQTVYRIAGINSASDMVKNQGKKGMWSGFTKGSSGLSGGIYSGGDFLYELKANVTFKGANDLWSHIDRNGYKWVDANESTHKITKAVSKYFTSLPDFVKVYGRKPANVMFDEKKAYLEGTGKFKATKKEIGIRKRDFIKWYYGFMKKFVNIHKEDLKKEISQSSLDNSMNGMKYNNDEIIFNDYTIKGLYIISDQEDEESFFTSYALNYHTGAKDALYGKQIETVKKYKLPYKGFIYRGDIENIKLPNNPASKYVFNIPLKKIEEFRKHLEEQQKRNIEAKKKKLDA